MVDSLPQVYEHTIKPKFLKQQRGQYPVYNGYLPAAGAVGTPLQPPPGGGGGSAVAAGKSGVGLGGYPQQFQHQHNPPPATSLANATNFPYPYAANQVYFHDVVYLPG